MYLTHYSSSLSLETRSLRMRQRASSYRLLLSSFGESDIQEVTVKCRYFTVSVQTLRHIQEHIYAVNRRLQFWQNETLRTEVSVKNATVNYFAINMFRKCNGVCTYLRPKRPVPVTARSKTSGLRPLACWDCGFESHREAWMFVCCECCVLSGRGLCDELITRPEESYRMCCVVVCDLETSWMRRPCPTGGCRAKNKQTS